MLIDRTNNQLAMNIFIIVNEKVIRYGCNKDCQEDWIKAGFYEPFRTRE